MSERFAARPWRRAGPWLLVTLCLSRPDLARGNAGPWPSTVQAEAPSINTASPTLLDRVDFPRRVGIAWDRRFERGVDLQALTLSTGWLDRAAARVTVGGPLQFVDSLRTRHENREANHVTSELKLRLLEHETSGRVADLGLALDADNLGTGYGLDRYGATLIAERLGPTVWTANAGYRILERYKSPLRMAETKLGLGAQWRWLTPLLHGVPVDFGLAGDCLLRNHDRDAAWQGAANVAVPVPCGLRLSFTARRSDRPEIRGDDRMREVLSLAYDPSGFAR